MSAYGSFHCISLICVYLTLSKKCFDCFAGVVELVKKLGNSSFEREDEEVTYILCFFRAVFQTLLKRLMMFGFRVD